jgi:predicted nucleic acid-binding protein
VDKHWVLNASPVILLAKAGVIHLVPKVCVRLVIPEGTVEEVEQGKAGDAGRAWLAGQGAQYVSPSPHIPEAVSRLALGLGETQVLAWLMAHPEFEGVLDDLKARRAAARLQLSLIGSLRVLIILKERGLLPTIRPAAKKFREAGSYISEPLIQKALKLAGEA